MISNYSGLKAKIEKWCSRNDVNADIDDFIDIAEAKMYESLRTRDMVYRQDITINAKQVALPSTDGGANPIRTLEIRRLRIKEDGSYYNVDYVTPDSLFEYNDTETGRPRYFTVTSQLEFDKTPDKSYTGEIVFYGTLPALDATNTTNAILSNYPMIYLQGAFWALFDSRRNEQLAEYRYGKFSQAIDEANAAANKGQYGPVKRMTPKGSRP